MNLLSITFHVEQNALPKWKNFLDNNFSKWLEETSIIDRFIFSEVESEMIEEGVNYNLLLIFKNQEIRSDFAHREMRDIAQIIDEQFIPQEVIIFPTFLNRISHQL